MSEARINALVKARDGLRMAADAIDEYLETMAPVGVKQASAASAVKEETLNILKFEPQEGAKIGAYDVAYKGNNIEDKWVHAYSVLRQANSTINARYRGPGYVYSYWIYGEGKIYRQKLKRS
ncbi:hypothetical protein MUO74_07330 [Candidatus Bathyarchaeota archaeon]|nr:hypothetical protein [Candidatus Bathyarchaeota archaeon]